jgi:hypothetical protein
MTALPNRNILDGTKLPATTTSEMKTALGAIRDFLSETVGVDSTKQVLLNPVASQMNGGQIAGNRNRITNGACQVAQVGSVAASAAPQYGGCDMIQTRIAGATGISGNIQQNGSQATSSSFAQALSAVSFTNGQPSFSDRIESKNAYDMSSNQVTYSCLYYQNTGSDQNISIRISKPTILDNFGTLTIISTDTSNIVPSGVLTLIKATFTLGSSDAAFGLNVDVFTTSVLTVISKSFQIADRQLELGSVATPFEQLKISTVIADCQRYYYQQPTFVLRGYQSTGASIVIVVALPVTMRAIPTATVVGATQYGNASSLTLTPYQTGYQMNIIATVTGDCYASASSASNFLKFDARL